MRTVEVHTAFTLINAPIVGPRGLERSKRLGVSGGRLARDAKGREVLLGDDHIVYPALVNVHDHLRGNYLPRVGPPEGVFYLNWGPWDADLKASPVFEERANIPFERIYFLSAYKNLFSGVTTVNDHFPHALNDEILPRLPIRAIREYAIEHECSSYDLKWGDGIVIEHARAVERDWPFITHLEEGFDPESQDGIGILERAGALDSHALLIHCIGFSDEDVAKVAKAGASVSWCPASNLFMFNTTCKIRKLLRAGVNVSIGTDSTHTGSYNLLAEARFARETYRELYGEDLPARAIYDMLTINPARAFRMQDLVGSLEDGKLADVLVLKRRHDDPFENLVSATSEDIELLLMEGEPLLATEELAGRLGAAPSGETVTIGGRKVLVKGEPDSLYREMRKAVGFDKKLEYLPFEPEARG